MQIEILPSLFGSLATACGQSRHKPLVSCSFLVNELCLIWFGLFWSKIIWFIAFFFLLFFPFSLWSRKKKPLVLCSFLFNSWFGSDLVPGIVWVVSIKAQRFYLVSFFVKVRCLIHVFLWIHSFTLFTDYCVLWSNILVCVSSALKSLPLTLLC